MSLQVNIIHLQAIIFFRVEYANWFFIINLYQILNCKVLSCLKT